MDDLVRLDAEFNRMIAEGRSEAAIERFYADDARLQENLEPDVLLARASARGVNPLDHGVEPDG
jgi:hypothetical protein